MERETRNHYQTRGSNKMGGSGVGVTNGPNNSSSAADRDLLLQWGNRKRLRCVKLQRKGESSAEKAVVSNGERRVLNRASTNYQRRNLEETPALRASKQQQQQSNSIRVVSSPGIERGGKGGNCGLAVFSDDKKGSSSGSEGFVWPNFAVSLTNKEKEDDFLILRGSKLPNRPKKRAKLIQKTVNLVCPGTWLSDLTLERYQVREKKVAKKRPRGLKAMQDYESDSE